MTKQNGVSGGLNVALECAAGEYAKTPEQIKKLAAGSATDTSDIVNEMIRSVKSFGRCGLIGPAIRMDASEPFQNESPY